MMETQISDAAVEAAMAEVVRVTSGELVGGAADTLVRAILEAVAPHILRDAADEFAARLPDGTGNGRVYNSHKVAHILRARADALGATK